MFEEDLHSYFITLGYRENNHPLKPSIMIQALKGIRLIKYKRLSGERQRDFGYVMNMLRNVYGRKTKNRMHVLRKIKEMVSSSYETLDQYAAAKLQLLENADIPEDDAVMHFLEGLSEDTQERL